MLSDAVTDDPGVFATIFDDFLCKNQSDEALNLILEPENENLVLLSCFDLISCIGSRMCNGDLFKRDAETWCTLQNILDYVLKICKPKESLIALLQLLSQIRSDEFFGEFVISCAYIILDKLILFSFCD